MAEETNEQKPRDESFRRSRYPRYRRPNRKPPEPASTEGMPAVDSPASSVSVNEAPSAGAAPQDNRAPQQPNQHRLQSIEISVVIPLYNEEQSLKELAEQLKNTLVRSGGRYELIFVDDGGT